MEEHAADHPGILDRLILRPDDPAVHGHARAEHDVDVQALAVRLQVAGDEGVGIEAAATRLPLGNHQLADLPEHIIVAGAQDDEIARAGQDRDLKRAVRPARRAAIQGVSTAPLSSDVPRS